MARSCKRNIKLTTTFSDVETRYGGEAIETLENLRRPYLGVWRRLIQQMSYNPDPNRLSAIPWNVIRFSRAQRVLIYYDPHPMSDTRQVEHQVLFELRLSASLLSWGIRRD